MSRSRPSSNGRALRVAPYDRYAAVYDEIGQRVFGERIAEATFDFLNATGRKPRTLLDLACGTGAATMIFAAAGMTVTGVDRSAAMLAVAEQVTQETGLPATWLQQDIRDLCLGARFELVTCFYDSLNYILSAEDLARVFARVREVVAPGGLFVFDLNTREKFGAAWSNACFVAADGTDIFGVYQSWYDPETGESPLILTFFVKDAEGKWDRFDEEHVERAYALSEVEQMVTGAGFTVEAMLDYPDRSPRFGPPGSERSHRVVFITTPAEEPRSVDNR